MSGDLHCWHDTGERFTNTIPPHGREICCYCGVTRVIQLELDPDSVVHGPFIAPEGPERIEQMTQGPGELR